MSHQWGGGVNIRKKGTGIPTIQPTRRIRLRPWISERYPAVAFAMALTRPKDTRNERIAALEAMPNTCEPRRGSSVRSVPTTEPTNAFNDQEGELFPVSPETGLE